MSGEGGPVTSVFTVENAQYGTVTDLYGVQRLGFIFEVIDTNTFQRIPSYSDIELVVGNTIEQIHNPFDYTSATQNYLLNGSSGNMNIEYLRISQYVSDEPNSSMHLFAKGLDPLFGDENTTANFINQNNYQASYYEVSVNGNYSDNSAYASGIDQLAGNSTTNFKISSNEYVDIQTGNVATFTVSGNVVAEIIPDTEYSSSNVTLFFFKNTYHTSYENPGEFHIVIKPQVASNQDILLELSNTSNFETVVRTISVNSTTAVPIYYNFLVNIETNSFYMRVNTDESNFTADTTVNLQYALYNFLLSQDGQYGEYTDSGGDYPQPLQMSLSENITLLLRTTFESDFEDLANSITADPFIYTKTPIEVDSASFTTRTDLAGNEQQGYVLTLRNQTTDSVITNLTELNQFGYIGRFDLTNIDNLLEMNGIAFYSGTNTLGFPFPVTHILTNATSLQLFCIGSTSIQDPDFEYNTNQIAAFLENGYYIYTNSTQDPVISNAEVDLLNNETNLTIASDSVSINTTNRAVTPISVFGNVTDISSYDGESLTNTISITSDAFKTKLSSGGDFASSYDLLLSFTVDPSIDDVFKLEISNNSSFFPSNTVYNVTISNSTQSAQILGKYKHLVDLENNVMYVRTTFFARQNISVNLSYMMFKQAIKDPDDTNFSNIFKPTSTLRTSNLTLKEGKLIIPDSINETFNLTNLVISNATYSNVKDVYGITRPGYLISFRDNSTNSIVNSITDFNEANLFARTNVITLNETYSNFFLYNGSQSFLKESPRGQLLEVNGTIQLFLSGSDSLSDINRVDELTNTRFYLYTNSTSESVVDTDWRAQLNNANLTMANVSIDTGETLTTNLSIAGTILYENELNVQNITNDTVVADIKNGFLEYSLLFDLQGATNVTEISISFSNSSSFDTVGLSLSLDDVNPTTIIRVPLHTIYNTTTNLSYLRLDDKLRSSPEVDLVITQVPFDDFQFANGTYNSVPYYVAPISRSIIRIVGDVPDPYNLNAFITQLQLEPIITNQKKAYVDTLPVMRKFCQTLLDSFSRWNTNSPSIPSINLSSTNGYLRIVNTTQT